MSDKIRISKAAYYTICDKIGEVKKEECLANAEVERLQSELNYATEKRDNIRQKRIDLQSTLGSVDRNLLY